MLFSKAPPEQLHPEGSGSQSRREPGGTGLSQAKDRDARRDLPRSQSQAELHGNSLQHPLTPERADPVSSEVLELCSEAPVQVVQNNPSQEGRREDTVGNGYVGDNLTSAHILHNSLSPSLFFHKSPHAPG